MLCVDALKRDVGGRTLFHGLRFELADGESLALSAPSGFGKSQILRCVAHLVPYDGVITFDGKTAAQTGITQWRRDIVYCPQTPPTYPGSPADLEHTIARFSAQAGTEHVSVHEIAKSWKVDDLWHKPWSTLSGGEAQRAALALALSTRPRLLLLDEPTSALDSATRDLVEERLQGVSAIWVTHDVAQAQRVATRVLELEPYGVNHG